MEKESEGDHTAPHTGNSKVQPRMTCSSFAVVELQGAFFFFFFRFALFSFLSTVRRPVQRCIYVPCDSVGTRCTYAETGAVVIKPLPARALRWWVFLKSNAGEDILKILIRMPDGKLRRDLRSFVRQIFLSFCVFSFLGGIDMSLLGFQLGVVNFSACLLSPAVDVFIPRDLDAV